MNNYIIQILKHNFFYLNIKLYKVYRITSSRNLILKSLVFSLDTAFITLNTCIIKLGYSIRLHFIRNTLIVHLVVKSQLSMC